MKTKDLNQIMSVLYLGLGYGFIYLWSFWTPEWGLTLFTAAYVTAVLGYCYGSGRKPARESWFWLTVLFAIAIPMNFYLTFGILQILALMMAAAYWTESVASWITERRPILLHLTCGMYLRRCRFGIFQPRSGCGFRKKKMDRKREQSRRK